jgi:hypothetical protein
VLSQTGATVYLYTNAATRITSGAVLLANTWAHVALTRSGTSMRLFINGVQVGGTYSSAANFSDGLCVIGKESTSAINWFSGYMDEFRVTKGVARYTSAFTPPAAFQVFGAPIDALFTWDRRTRLKTNFTNGYVPLGEAAESYQVDVFADNTYAVVKRTLTATSPSVTYTTAQQISDFGSAQSTFYLDVYQVSAVVGRGYKLRGTV